MATVKVYHESLDFRGDKCITSTSYHCEDSVKEKTIFHNTGVLTVVTSENSAVHYNKNVWTRVVYDD